MDHEATPILQMLMRSREGKYWDRCARLAITPSRMAHLLRDLGNASMRMAAAVHAPFWHRLHRYMEKLGCASAASRTALGGAPKLLSLVGDDGCDAVDVYADHELVRVCVVAAVVSPKWRQSVTRVRQIPPFVLRVFRTHARQALPYSEDARGAVTSVNGMALREHKDADEIVRRRTWFCHALVSLNILCSVTLSGVNAPSWVIKAVFSLLMHAILLHPISSVRSPRVRAATRAVLKRISEECPTALSQAECMYYAFCSIAPNSQRLVVPFDTFFTSQEGFQPVVEVMIEFLTVRMARLDLSSFLPVGDWFERHGADTSIMFGVNAGQEHWSFCRYHPLSPGVAVSSLLSKPALVFQGLYAHALLTTAASCKNAVALHFPPSPSGKTYHFWVSYQAACNACTALAQYPPPFTTDAPDRGTYVFISMELLYCLRNVMAGFVMERWVRCPERIAAHPMLLCLWYRKSMMGGALFPGCASSAVDNTSRYVVISTIVGWMTSRSPRAGCDQRFRRSIIPPYVDEFSVYDMLPHIVWLWCPDEAASNRVFEEELARVIIRHEEHAHPDPDAPPLDYSWFPVKKACADARKRPRRCFDYSRAAAPRQTLCDVLLLFLAIMTKKCMCSQRYFEVRALIEDSEAGADVFTCSGFSAKMRQLWPELYHWFTRRRPALQNHTNFAEALIPLAFERELPGEEVPWEDATYDLRAYLLTEQMYRFLTSGLLCRDVAKRCLEGIFPCAREQDRLVCVNHTLATHNDRRNNRQMASSLRLMRAYVDRCCRVGSGIRAAAHLLSGSEAWYRSVWVDPRAEPSRARPDRFRSVYTYNMALEPYEGGAEERSRAVVFGNFLSKLEWVALYYHDRVLDDATLEALKQHRKRRRVRAYRKTKDVEQTLTASGCAHPCRVPDELILSSHECVSLAVSYDGDNGDAPNFGDEGLFLCDLRREGECRHPSQASEDERAMKRAEMEFLRDVSTQPASFTATWTAGPRRDGRVTAQLDKKATLRMKNMLGRYYSSNMDAFMDSAGLTDIFGFISGIINE